ncbi:MAG: hypothetical protein WAL59_07765, partial [Roseiarcus sp.]
MATGGRVEPAGVVHDASRLGARASASKQLVLVLVLDLDATDAPLHGQQEVVSSTATTMANPEEEALRPGRSA